VHFLKSKNKKRLLIANFVTLLAGGLLLAQTSYAWINTNEYINLVEIQTGDGKASVRGYIFKRLYDSVSTYTNQTPDLDAVRVSSSSGQILFNFDDTAGEVFSQLNLVELYKNEHSVNAWAIPSYFVELQLSSITPLSYVKISMKLLDYAVGETIPSFTNFSYRYNVLTNNVLNSINYATSSPNFVSNLNAKGLINIETGIKNYQPTINDQIYDSVKGRVIDEMDSEMITLAVAPENELFYRENYIKSVVVELTPDPLEFITFIKNNPNIASDNILIGRKLAFDFEYSLVPFGV